MSRKFFCWMKPLGALDLKLRQEMQYELKTLQKELGITFVYVTHDQEEALTMSDTVVVMNNGVISRRVHLKIFTMSRLMLLLRTL